MGARQRLNSVYLFVALAIAAIIGGASGSWLVFSITFGALLFMLIHGGDIRPKPKPPQQRRRR